MASSFKRLVWARRGVVLRLLAFASLCLATSAFVEGPTAVGCERDEEIVDHASHMYDSYVYMLGVIEAPRQSHDALYRFSRTLKAELEQTRADREEFLDPAEVETQIRSMRGERYYGWYVSHPVVLAAAVKPDAKKFPPKLERDPRKPSTPATPEETRSIKSETEIAAALAKIFHVIQQPFDAPNPRTHPDLKPGKKPDMIVNDKIFDVYSPQTDTSAANIILALSKKSKQQATRLVLDLTGFSADDVTKILAEIAANFKLGKYEGDGDFADLEELWVRMPDGSIVRVHPVANKTDGTPGDPEVVVPK